MAEEEKTSPEVATAPPEIVAYDDGPVPRPAGWMYKAIRFGPLGEIWYASPLGQLLTVAMVCFLCPGMFNALTGMGGGGQLSTKASSNANTALYSTFAFIGFFSGSITNTIGIKATLSFGGIGYCIYSASFLCYTHTQNEGFVIFAGAFLGVCAGMLWSAQGAIMMSYPQENDKGHYIGYFWIIFNMGAVVGALIPLGQNIHNTNSVVSDGTYAAFIVLEFVGLCLSFCLVDAKKIVRTDGSRVILMQHPSWKSEFMGLVESITHEPWIIALFPMFFASNVFYTYQQNEMNALYFNTRTRALNNVLYWMAQIFGAVIFGYALDTTRIRRSVRAKVMLCTLFAVSLAIWGGGYAWQKIQPSRQAVTAKDTTYVPVDWTDGGKKYIGPMFLYIFYGFFDAAWQTTIYWYMGALSNSGRKAANLAGFYKGFQSAGAAIFWRLDAMGKPINTMFGATWGMLSGCLLLAAPIVFMRITDTTSVEEDLKFSDETLEDVMAPGTVKSHGDEHIDA